MAKKELNELSLEELKKKEKEHKGIILIFLILIAALFFFILRDYFSEQELDWSILTIAICTLGGPATLYPTLKEVQKEIQSRDETKAQ